MAIINVGVLDQSDIDKATAQGCSIYINDALITTSSSLCVGDRVEVRVVDVAKEFELVKPVYWIGSDDYAETFELVFDVVGNTANTVLTGRKFFTYAQLFVKTKVKTISVTSTNEIYKVTPSILGEVNEKRFKHDPTSDTVYDYGQFIISVLKLPFNLPPEIVGIEDTIKLATLDTTVSANVILTELIEINMGDISVPAAINSSDYLGKTATLYLPRANSIELDISYVLGQTISIKYLVDCYTGNVTINISSTKTNSTIISTVVDMGVVVPYSSTITGPTSSGQDIRVVGDNEITQAYVEIAQYAPELVDGKFTSPIYSDGLLYGNVGYVVVDNIELRGNILKEDKDDIIQILNRGVILN